MKFDEFLGDTQTQAQAAKAMTIMRGMVALREGLEDAGDFFRRHSNTGVGNFYGDVMVIQTGFDGDLAVIGREFNGVFQEVPKNLLQPHG